MIHRRRDASDGCRDSNADAAQIVDPGVLDRHRSAAGAQSDIDAIRGELVDLAIVDDQSLAGKKADAVDPVPVPLMSRPRSVTWSDGPADTMMAFVPETSTPAVTPSQAIVIAFVIVTPPKPPGSRQ